MTASLPAEKSDPLIGSVLGRHVLVRMLGEGGMGMVYEATHRDLGRRAAVKILHPRFARSDEVRGRFVREGRAASRVSHSNVVHVYDVGVEGSQPYLVMELLEGEDLGRLAAREGVLSVQRAADLLVPVVAAVAAAHELGVVHRDLKPENIFIAVERGIIKPKVLDFGISKIVDREPVEPLTGTGAFLGTPQYMSPEQAQGAKHIDQRSDQYSLGVILYQCVTGRRPLEEPSVYALLQRIVRGEFPPPRQLVADLPLAFEALILRAMAREPEKRFESTRALGRALLEFTSERVRAQYSDELAVDALAPTAIQRPVTPVESPGLGTTLGESVTHRDLPPTAASAKRWLGVGAAVIALATLLFARSWSGARPSVRSVSSASSAAAVRPPPATNSDAPVARKAEPPQAPSSSSAPLSPSAVAPAVTLERKLAPRPGAHRIPANKPAPAGSATTIPAAPSSAPSPQPQSPAPSASSDPYSAQK